MPIHDWTRVPAGPIHDFHLAWIAELRRSLNSGLLPGGYYAQAEQVALLASRQHRLVIRHTTGEQIVAILEIVSLGNKEQNGALEAFVDKVVGALDEGYHLMVIDLFPPGPCDPQGMHGAVWQRLKGAYQPPPGKPLTLAAYVAAGAVTCYVEPTAVGSELLQMPLFLTREMYVNVPLEQTYMAAYEGVPRRWKRVIDGGA